MKMHKGFARGVLAVLVLALAACGGSSGGGDDSGGNGGGAVSAATPADGARAFFSAVFTGESADAQNYICSALAEQGADEMVAAFDTMKTVLTVAGGTIDISGMVFTTTSESGDNAQVRVSGALKSSQQGVEELEFPEMDVPMAREGGVWKVCV